MVLVLVFTALRFGVWLSLYGQGLRLSLRGSGARGHCRARQCTNTAYGQDCACLSVVLVLRASLRALVRGYGLWARVVRVSPWSWCSVRFARIGVRIRPMGKDCACFSVVLVLSAICAHWCTDTAHGQGLRFLSVVLVLSASCAHWCADTAYGQGLRVFLRGPGAQRHCVCWCTDTASGQGCACFSVSWCSCVQSGHLRRSGLVHEAGQLGPCTQVHGQGFPRHQGGEGVAGTPGACSQVFCHPIRCIVRVAGHTPSCNTRSEPPPPRAQTG